MKRSLATTSSTITERVSDLDVDGFGFNSSPYEFPDVEATRILAQLSTYRLVSLTVEKLLVCGTKLSEKILQSGFEETHTSRCEFFHRSL